MFISLICLFHVLILICVFILKQGIDTIKVETDVSIDNEEDVIGMETDEICVPQASESEVSHFLR